MIKILNIYAQSFEHQDAEIIGNEEGLLALKGAIEIALVTGQSSTPKHNDCVFASDGEGYTVKVEMHNDDFYNLSPNNYWHIIIPQYMYPADIDGDADEDND